MWLGASAIMALLSPPHTGQPGSHHPAVVKLMPTQPPPQSQQQFTGATHRFASSNAAVASSTASGPADSSVSTCSSVLDDVGGFKQTDRTSALSIALMDASQANDDEAAAGTAGGKSNNTNKPSTMVVVFVVVVVWIDSVICNNHFLAHLLHYSMKVSV